MLDSDPSFTKLSNDTVRTINDFAGTKIPLNEKGSVVNMCKAWRDQYDSGIQEGRAEGREEERLSAIRTMIEFGLPKDLILKKYSEDEYIKASQELMNV